MINKYKIDYMSCKNITELIYKIEDYINCEYNSDLDDLDWVSQSLSEFNYYNNTNK